MKSREKCSARYVLVLGRVILTQISRHQREGGMLTMGKSMKRSRNTREMHSIDVRETGLGSCKLAKPKKTSVQKDHEALDTASQYVAEQHS